jgi:hypothetical protein
LPRFKSLQNTASAWHHDGVRAAVMGICLTFESCLPDVDPPCDEI